MRLWLFLAAINGFLAVAGGAFGAHWLKAHADAEMLAIFETASRYQMLHALALIGIAWLASRQQDPWVTAAGAAFVLGIILFSGALYLIVLTGWRGFGAIAPVGGLALLAGWIGLAIAALRL